jgi:hypothetical protein
MNDEYQERGIFKQLVLIAFLVGGWISHKVEQAWKSEAFWWWILCCAFGLAGVLGLKCAVMR